MFKLDFGWQAGMALMNQTARMAALMSETQLVMTMRTLGAVGLWPMPKGETLRMFQEKPPAFAEGMVAASNAAIRGKTPGAVVDAWAKPLTRTARSNRRRLSKVGR